MESKEKRGLSLDAIIAIIILIITVAFAIDGILIQKLPFDALRYPIFCMVVIATTCGIEIFNSCKKNAKTKNKEEVYTNKTNFLLAFAFIIAYAILMWLVGFIISSIALTIAFTLKFKIKHPVPINIGATLVIIGAYFLFSKVLYIFLPKGLLLQWIF